MFGTPIVCLANNVYLQRFLTTLARCRLLLSISQQSFVFDISLPEKFSCVLVLQLTN